MFLSECFSKVFRNIHLFVVCDICRKRCNIFFFFLPTPQFQMFCFTVKYIYFFYFSPQSGRACRDLLLSFLIRCNFMRWAPEILYYYIPDNADLATGKCGNSRENKLLTFRKISAFFICSYILYLCIRIPIYMYQKFKGNYVKRAHFSGLLTSKLLKPNQLNANGMHNAKKEYLHLFDILPNIRKI